MLFLERLDVRCSGEKPRGMSESEGTIENKKLPVHGSLRLPLMFTDGRSHVLIEQAGLLGR